MNTGGGIVAGDHLSVDVTVGANASVTLTTAAAEKTYRTDGRTSVVSTSIALAAHSRVAWAPLETILFDDASLTRRFEADVAESATFMSAEIMVFGRIAHGERDISGRFRESWRIRRAGRLVFADETALEGEIGACLDRSAVAQGARAMAFIIVASPDAADDLDRLRAIISAQSAAAAGGVEGAASLRDGIVLARLIGSPECLRHTVTATLAALAGPPM